MKIGDKVICIKSPATGYATKKGKHYTIQNIITNIFGEVVLMFIEADNGHEYKTDDYNYWGHNIDRFRKLITDHSLTSEITRELANKPLIKEGIERIEVKELI